MGAHLAPDVVMVALGEEMAIHFAHPFIPEGPGIVLLVVDAPTADLKAVTLTRVLRELSLKHPGVIRRLGADHLPIDNEVDPVGLWHPCSDRPARVRRLGSENREGMVVATFGQTPTILNHPVEDCSNHDPTAVLGGSLSGKTRLPAVHLDQFGDQTRSAEKSTLMIRPSRLKITNRLSVTLPNWMVTSTSC